MSLERFKVTVNGHETVMKLSEADAKALGGVPVGASQPAAPAAGSPDAPESKVAKAPANKARTASNKAAESE